jgi:hypothetical protein
MHTYVRAQEFRHTHTNTNQNTLTQQPKHVPSQHSQLLPTLNSTLNVYSMRVMIQLTSEVAPQALRCASSAALGGMHTLKVC